MKLLPLIAALALAGCDGTRLGDGSVDPDLVGAWSLTSFDGEVTLRPGDPYTLTLAESGEVTAVAACNECGGSAEASGGAFDASLICPRAACARSAEFSGAVNRADGYEVVTATDRTLRLSYAGADGRPLVLVFEPVPE